jgi:hypothetical protein
LSAPVLQKYPAAEIADSVGQHAGCNGGSAGEVRKVRPDTRTGGRPSDGVAKDTGVGEKDLLSVRGLGIRGRDRALCLCGHPVVEVFLRFAHYVKRHMRVLQATIFCALATPSAHFIHLHQDVGCNQARDLACLVYSGPRSYG